MFDKESPEAKLRSKFWESLKGDRTVMLGLKGVEDDRTRRDVNKLIASAQ